MLRIADGQCGMCSHFAEGDASKPQVIQIRIKGEAPADLVESCGHPQHAGLDLKVSPVSGCQGFSPAQVG